MTLFAPADCSLWGGQKDIIITAKRFVEKTDNIDQRELEQRRCNLSGFICNISVILKK